MRKLHQLQESIALLKQKMSVNAKESDENTKTIKQVSHWGSVICRNYFLEKHRPQNNNVHAQMTHTCTFVNRVLNKEFLI